MMLQGLNRIGQSWVGKAIVFVLFGLLIVSFAIWGIGDIFRGGVRTTVATVGKQEISAEAFRTAYQNELQRLMRQARRSITPEQARALGLDARVLARLVSDAAIDQKARELGLSVSDQLVAQSIAADPNFRGANGQFDRAVFADLLRNNGLTEAAYLREQRGIVARLHVAEALTGALPVPLAAREAIHRYSNERRAAGYLTLTVASLGALPEPTDAQLASFFETRKAEFRAPEYRALSVLALDPASLAKPETVTDEEVRQRYEQVKERFGTPERRSIQQISFPSQTEAEGAYQRIKDGATFDAVAAERRVGPTDLELGTFTRSELIDPAVADAAFALAEGAVSGPVAGRFGPVLLRVTRIEAESLRPLASVAGELRAEVATEKARASIESVHDEIEDLRAGARPLVDVARQKNLALVTVPAVDRQGRDKAGHPVSNLPERDAVITAAFGSDIGADNEALRTRDGGYVWFDVTGIEPGRDKALGEVRDQVAAQWRGDEVARQLAERANALVERLDKGESLETIAGEAGATPKTAADLPRTGEKDELTRGVVARIFATPVGKAASAAGADETRVVFKVTGADMPPFVTSTQQAAAVEEQLRTAIADDLIAEYISQVEKEVGLTVSQENLRRAVGGGDL